LSCGLCCDGSLIGFVELGKDEQTSLSLLMEIEKFEEAGFFMLPCINLGCDGCKIYSKRPKQCGKFECGLLKSIEKNELDLDSALEAIRVFKHKKIAIEKQFDTLPFQLVSPSFYFKVLELRNLLKKKRSELSVTPRFVKLLSDIDDLNDQSLKSFGISYF